jgi:hypothetical protein
MSNFANKGKKKVESDSEEQNQVGTSRWRGGRGRGRGDVRGAGRGDVVRGRGKSTNLKTNGTSSPPTTQSKSMTS